jgi:glycosyltransferase involved in cell wall biosynthesis
MNASNNGVRISILLESFQPEYWGGRETRWKNIIQEISKHHPLTVFGDFTRCYPEVAFPNVKARFINIGPLPKMYSANGNRSLRHALIYTFKSLKLLKFRADVILTDQTPLITIPILRIISSLSKSQLSITWHEVWSLKTWFRYSKFLGILGFFLQGVAILFSKNIVVPSGQVSLDLSSNLFSRESKVIPNGVRVFDQTSEKQTVRENEGQFRLLYVGRLIKHKNCDFLIETMRFALQKNKNWHLTIIGDGPLKSQLFESVRLYELHQYIEFQSNLPEEELIKEYARSDVFFFPSQREGFGISVAEAISVGLPVVLYDVKENAATALITGKDVGIKVEQLEVEEWVRSIEEALPLKSTDKSRSGGELDTRTWKSISDDLSIYLHSLRGT